MAFKCLISPQKRALALFLRRETCASYSEIGRKCKISKSSAERIFKEDMLCTRSVKHPKRVGRPRKLSKRDARSLKRNLLQLRKERINLTVKELVAYSGFSPTTASRRTYSRYLNQMGFKFLQARKKDY